MKNMIAIGAIAGAVVLSLPFTASPVQAQTKAECRQHLVGSQRATGPARDAMVKRYQDCLKKAKK